MEHISVGQAAKPDEAPSRTDGIARLQAAIAAAKQRLAPFEQRYGVSSEYFMAEMAAEDLEGGDEEYVQWAGEYQLLVLLEKKTSSPGWI